ncbi:MAG: hypothetical protein VXW31_05015 [Planctomycetota bacterium]|nr:hypothetical protein [Planctomycetota bacterium]
MEKELEEAQSEETKDWLRRKLGGARAMLAQRLREEGEREDADGADAEVVAAVAAAEPTTDTTAGRRFAVHSLGLGRVAAAKDARARRAAEATATVAAAQEPAAAAGSGSSGTDDSGRRRADGRGLCPRLATAMEAGHHPEDHARRRQTKRARRRRRSGERASRRE